MDLLEKYSDTPDQEKMGMALQQLASNLDAFESERVYKECFSMMDLTTLKTDDTPESVSKLVCKVNAFRESYPDWPLPASVCVYPNFAHLVAQERTQDYNVTAVSACFPTSQSFLEVKLKECELAVEYGADEIDMVINIGWLKDKRYDDILNEIKAVKEACHGRILKVIIETCLLTDEEKMTMCKLVTDSGAEYIKTSTGFAKTGATPSDVAMLKANVGRNVKVKAAGGISSLEDADLFLKLGASRLGTSKIVQLFKQLKGK